MLKKDFSKPLHIQHLVRQDDAYVRAQAVCDCEYAVKIVVSGWGPDVHCDGVAASIWETASGSGRGHSGPVGSPRAQFVALALGTRGYVRFPKVAFHAWPVEGVPERVVSFWRAKMAEFVVGDAEQCFSYVLHVWDEELIIYEPKFGLFANFRHPEQGAGEFLGEWISAVSVPNVFE